MPHRPRLIAAAGALLAALVCATPASARIVEIGAGAAEATPTCPSSPCLAVSRTTGYQAKVVDSRAAYVVPADGRIVAWTISLGSPDERQIEFFEDNYGEASAGLTILRRGKRLFHRVMGADAGACSCSRTSARRCSSRSTARSPSRRATWSR